MQRIYRDAFPSLFRVRHATLSKARSRPIPGRSKIFSSTVFNLGVACADENCDARLRRKVFVIIYYSRSLVTSLIRDLVAELNLSILPQVGGARGAEKLLSSNAAGWQGEKTGSRWLEVAPLLCFMNFYHYCTPRVPLRYKIRVLKRRYQEQHKIDGSWRLFLYWVASED